MQGRRVGGRKVKKSFFSPLPSLFLIFFSNFRGLSLNCGWSLRVCIIEMVVTTHTFGVLWTSCEAQAAAGVSQDVQSPNVCCDNFSMMQTRRTATQRKTSEIGEKRQKRGSEEEKKKALLEVWRTWSGGFGSGRGGPAEVGFLQRGRVRRMGGSGGGEGPAEGRVRRRAVRK